MKIIAALKEGFKAKAEGLVETPTKPTIHPRPGCLLRALPGYLKKADISGLKWVSAYPSNTAQGLPLTSGLVILNDSKTGLPNAIIEGTRITAWRTAGVSTIAAQLLARPGASTLALCGAGVQGRTHLDFLVTALPGLKRVQVFDTNPAALDHFLAKQGANHPRLEIAAALSAMEAVQGADIIITAAPMPEKRLAILRAGDIAPGTLSLPLDLDSYFDPSGFMVQDLIFSDDPAQVEAFQSQGRFEDVKVLAGDYGNLLTGARPGRTDESQRIMAISIGTAVGDLIIADMICRRAFSQGLGQMLEL
ncbi:MAG: ornithine cyclodeaminase family protein [Deltaproteobacteria bacterium]|nr:ornithine cyclodeaminase family protein [Deltaproteobacteria bacterium]